MDNQKAMLKSFSDDIGFVRFQIESFNNFIDNGLQKIIDEIGEITPEVPEIGELIIKLGKANIGEPRIREADGTSRKILPLEARLRDMSYVAPIYVEIVPIINKKEQEPATVHIGDLPIMIKSKLCPLSKMSEEELIKNGEDPNDPGAYFIINGTERVLVLIEEIASNRMIVGKQNIGNFTEMLRINSERNGYIQRHSIERKNDGSIYISFANIRRLPIVILLKLLGMENDKEIIENLSDDQDVTNEFYSNIYETEVATASEAIDYVGSYLKITQKEYQKSRVNQIIDKYLLPHIGQERTCRKKKGEYILHGIRKIIQASLGKIPVDDIDHYGNKRIKLSGDLLQLLFRSILVGRWGLVARIKYNYQKMAKRGKLPPIQTIVEANVVTNQLASAMATGAWVGGRTGVSQRLERKNFAHTISHLRLALSPLTATQEHFEARELHPTHWGRWCPSETPEGPTIGLRKHLALLTEITKGISEIEKKKLLSSIKLSEGKTLIFLDGDPIGTTNEPKEILKTIKEKRIKGTLSKEINVALYPELNELRISTDAGRVRRPLIRLEDGRATLSEDKVDKLKSGEITWNEIIKDSSIEYIDAEEEDNLFIALYSKDITTSHTHVELSPSMILGLSAGMVVYPEHDRGDRVNYGAKMVGQAIGLYQSNFNLRTDTKSNTLVYPQKPLVETDVISTIGLDNHPFGQNVVVALANFEGYNMEDGIVFNKASIERGLLRSMFFRIYPCEEKRYWGGQEDTITIPEKDVRGYKSEDEYKNLAEDGIISPEVLVKSEDVLVGRVSPMRFLSANELMSGIANMRESSSSLRFGETGIVDRIFMTENINGNKLVKVVVRDMRIPELGDKFASRHGQKGVIGRIASEEDMPFTSRGMIPDIVLNPHSIPSRQTIGQLLEIISSKTGALRGKKFNGTAFANSDEKDIRSQLQTLGFRNDGKEILYNGITGEKYEVEIFTGMLFYLKLDHMVANKLQSRSRGPVTLLTRQPTEGKAKEGGLRLGEMEKDCLIAHGAVLTLKERFDSDKITVPICKKCGIVGKWDRSKDKYICPLCKDSETLEVEMSYAFKLLLDELKTLLIYPKVNVIG